MHPLSGRMSLSFVDWLGRDGYRPRPEIRRITGTGAGPGTRQSPDEPIAVLGADAPMPRTFARAGGVSDGSVERPIRDVVQNTELALRKKGGLGKSDGHEDVS